MTRNYSSQHILGLTSPVFLIR